MSKIKPSKIVMILVIIVTFVSLVSPLVFFHCRYLGMTNPIATIGGGYSGEPGWPCGPTWVSVDSIQVGILSQAELIEAIESQHSNEYIASISMSGQHLDIEIAAAVIETSASAVDITGCAYSPSSVGKLLESTHLRIIVCSPADAEVLRSIVRKVRPDVKVMSHGNIDSADTTNRAP